MTTLKKDNNSSYITKNIKKSVYPKKVKIWQPSIKKDNWKSDHYNFMIIRSTKKADKLVAFFDFKISGSNIVCAINGVEIPWKKRFDLDLNLFPEFELFINIFEINDFDIFKISQSSAIYYFNDSYYKIRVISGDSIIFNVFKHMLKLKEPNLYIKDVILMIFAQQILIMWVADMKW